VSTASDPASPPPVGRHTLWRHWWKVGLVLITLAALLIGGVMRYASTPQFEDRVREKVIAILEGATGGRVELGAFRWRVLRLEFEADNLTIHGLEPAGQVPYAHIDRLFVRVKIISFFRTKIGLNYLEADHPVVHLIVYPDGSTNQPRPKTESTSNEPITDTLFDLQVNRTELNDGLAIVDQQATPFDLAANNLGIKLQYVPPPLGHPTQDLYQGSIHIEDLAAQRGVQSPIHSKLDLRVQLGRNAATLQSFNLQTGPSTLAGRLALQNFADPQWKGALNGSVDVRMVESFVSIPGLDKGNVELQLTGQGTSNTFTVDGQSKVIGGAYHTGTIHLAGVNATTALHLNENELTLTNAQARLTEGGIVEGSLRIVNWLNNAPPAPEKPPAATGRRGPAPAPPGNQEQGTIRAHIRDMTVASIMSVVAPPRDANLGFATVASGPVNLDWKGDSSNFVMDAKLAFTAPQQPRAGEVPLNGTVDGQYLNGSGTVNIRSFTAQTPATHIQVNGALGVYPPTRASQVNVDLTTSNLAEFDRTLRTLGLAAQGKTGVQAIPVALHGQAAFHGTVTRSILTPDVKGHLTATNFDLIYSAPQQLPLTQPAPTQPTTQSANQVHQAAQSINATPATEHTLHWDSLEADAEYAPELISVQQASLVHGATTIHASGTLHAHELTHHNLAFDEDSALRLDASIQDASLTDILQSAGEAPPVNGTVNLEVHASGQLNNLSGGGHLAVQGGDIYGEPYHTLTTDLRFAGREIDASHLVFLQDGGKVQGDGGYNLSTNEIHFTARGTGFELSHFKLLQGTKYPISGTVAFEAHGNGTVKDPKVEGNLHLTRLNLADASTGYIDLNAHTQSGQLLMDLNGHMTNAVFQGHGQVQLSGDYQAKGQVTVSNLDVDALLQTLNIQSIKAHSSIAGAINVSGPLKQPKNLGGDATIDQFSLSLAGVPLKTEGPLHATLMNGRLHLDPFHVVGDDTNLHAQGSVGLFGDSRDLDLHGNGSINMKLAQTLDSDITASGHVDFNVDAVGTFQRPSLTGQVKFTNVAMALQDFPNGLSQMNGTLEFDQDRLDVKSLTATSGGGKIQLGGFVTYQQGLYGDLTATVKDVRIRYPQGVSSMADAKLRLQGTQTSLLLSGNVTITRFAIGGDLDLAALSSSSGSVSLPPDPNAPSSHLRLDIHIVSAPQLDFQNSYAKLAGDVDLRVRGTLSQPSLLGHIAITEGSASFAGTKYELQRGDIYFSNPVRIEPLIDLTATAHVEDYDITIGLNGTSSKLQPTFRSEPPLSEQDIFALLAVGRTQEEQQIYSMQQQQAGVNSTADALLGGALNATVSSRVEKLFGGGSVKIDPNYVTGTGNSSARITVEQQVAKNATLTYATNINSTAEQFIQGQVNLTRNLSVIAVRDESGVFSLIFKIRRRYK
jgi:translocation and assembly module TamB